ncbi:MAG: thymidine phosphorylase, partial [Clostridia bacterium]|nr:thymidine phosphorylase [Clostridia bacterium]
TAALLLGAGRSRKEDAIDYTAGIYLHAKVGAFVRAGEKIATLYTTEHPEAFGAAEEKLLSSTVLSDTAPQKRPLIFDVIEA